MWESLWNRGRRATGAAIWVFAAVGAAAAANGATIRPNVILIVSDNQGYYDLRCFGNPDVVSPNLDRMAAEGVKATNFYVNSGACTPARGSIITGRYPQRNGLYDQIRNYLVDYGHKYTLSEYAISPEMTLGLDVREMTFGQLMKNAGYATAAIGKWDSGRARRFLPQQRGFDYFYGLACTGIDYWTHERYGIPSMFRGNELVKEEGFSEELFTREALRFIQQNHDKPFFLYLPYHAPSGNANFDEKRIRPPTRYMDLYPGKEKERLTEYYATITCMDDGIGQIMASLKSHGIDERTLVIFFPDNGSGGRGPLRFTTGRQYDRLSDGSIRVCFIARWPGVLPAGTSTNEFLSALEIFPTLAALVGTPLDKLPILDGFDMLPVLQGKIPSRRKEMFWQTRNGRAARVDNYKWADTPSYSGLFDVTNDPGEKNDLSITQPDTLALVRSRWENWRREMDAAEPRGPFLNY